MLLEIFAHLTKIEVSFRPVISLIQFATFVAACKKLEILSIMDVDLLLGSPSTSFLSHHFPPPTLRSVQITENGAGFGALYGWLSSAASPLPIDTIAIQNYGEEYTASVLGFLRNARPSL